MSEPDDPAATIERLQRRLAREKSARLQAESIAERIASDRWELSQQLEDKLARRTSELEAARRAASDAVTERERCLSQMTHDLRTPLTALVFLSESLSAAEPINAQQLEELASSISRMRTVMDAAASAPSSKAPAADGTRASAADSPPATFADIVSAHEEEWHQLAARAGKLLMVDIEIPSGHLPAHTADEVNELVLGLIRERLDTSEPVIELRLRPGSAGVQAG